MSIRALQPQLERRWHCTGKTRHPSPPAQVAKAIPGSLTMLHVTTFARPTWTTADLKTIRLRQVEADLSVDFLVTGLLGCATLNHLSVS
ncbi:hypothetical protein J6590_027461 [Homalodisca vitripennis]|nr:hypothetical protein J6590_027461 [Homalodisca vitripennis]